MHLQHDQQTTETQRSLTGDSLRKTVTQPRRGDWRTPEGSLFTRDAQRKFLNDGECRRALSAADTLPEDRALFVQVLAWTGARVSEVLALTPRSFQIEDGLVTIVTLKRRTFSVRDVPVSDKLLAALERFFRLSYLQGDDVLGMQRLWKFCRMTAWRIVKAVMRVAGIAGPQACPKGFRHAFGRLCVRRVIPLHLIQYWMGHARLSTTTIYMKLSGSEERLFAERLWSDTPTDVPPQPPFTYSAFAQAA